MKQRWTVILAVLFFGHCTCVDGTYDDELRNTARIFQVYETHYKKVNLYAHKYLYPGLTNLKKNIDSIDTHFYNAHDFDELLQRVQKQEVGILGIEAWKDGEFYDVAIYEDAEGTTPYDSAWYLSAFRSLQHNDSAWMYMCSFEIPPERLTEFENDSSLLDTNLPVCKWPVDWVL